MRYADKVSEIMNAFSPEPLKSNELEQFYCSKTMEYRMSDKYSSPMEDILEMCQLREIRHVFLLLGHRGCGKSAAISMEDADRALEELKASLTRRIEQKDYVFLRNIHQGNKEGIEDKEVLLKMLQASVVLEYNGTRWHNVHPLVAQFLEEQGMIGNAEI